MTEMVAAERKAASVSFEEAVCTQIVEFTEFALDALAFPLQHRAMHHRIMNY